MKKHNFGTEMKWTNYHQHCHFDDGTETVEEHVQSALKQGVINMGFSGHCPIPFDNKWCIPKNQIHAYTDEIELVKSKYDSEIRIFKSLEIDFIPGIISPNDHWLKSLSLDYTLGSIHFVNVFEDGLPWGIDGTHQGFLHGLEKIFHRDVIKVVEEYFDLTRQMVRSACPDIIGHLDKIKIQNRNFWDENASWYQEAILNTLEEIRSTDAIIEVNTRGIYKKLSMEPYPGKWILEKIHEMNIPIQLNSDAHHPREITNKFRQTAKLLNSIGFQNLWVLLNQQWQPVPFNENGLIMD